MTSKKGFTLVELLIVIAIISILSSIVIASVRVARLKAYNAKAQADGNQLRTAILQLEGDTVQLPNHLSASSCTENVATYSLTASAPTGIVQNDTTPYPNWKGPYSDSVPNDPWNRNYRFSKWYTCNGQIGCTGIANGTRVRAIFSQGINGADDLGVGSDDIVTVLCI